MQKLSAYLLLPLMLINLTVAENRWTLAGLRPDVFIYAATIALASYTGLRSQHWRASLLALAVAIVARVLELVGGDEALHGLSFAALAIVFGIAGGMIYGPAPQLLRRQLVLYLALCVPIMLAQILGTDSWLMGWNIGYLHDPNLLTDDEIGTFKELPLYPTLFVGVDDLVFTTGQARPVGLMYAANPLSIFLSIAATLNLAIDRRLKIGISDVVITLAVVLAMSKLSLGMMVLLYASYLAFGIQKRRWLTLQLIMLLFVVLAAYYLAFPGLFSLNLSEGMVMGSVMLRLVDLVTALGLGDYFEGILELGRYYSLTAVYEPGEGYSGVANLIRSQLVIPMLIAAIPAMAIYLRGVGSMAGRSATVYVVTLAACALTQFGVPFMGATSFQLIMGFALYPFLTEVAAWRRKPNGYLPSKPSW